MNRTRVSGGDICDAWRVEDVDGIRFRKELDGADAGLFAAEADGLGLLSGAGVNTPNVRDVGPTWLELDWIDEHPAPTDADWRAAGQMIATLHMQCGDSFGGGITSWLGPIRLDNTPEQSWEAFLVQRRILPQLRRARDTHLIDRDQATRIERSMACLAAKMPTEPPRLIHGDLWSGNLMLGSDGTPMLVDPAATYAHRELELAMMRMFGGFPTALWDGYEATLPVDEGFSSRCRALQTFPLLVHANLFGGAWVRQAIDAGTSYG